MKYILTIAFFFIAAGVAAEDLTIQEFSQLSENDQDTIFSASYQTATVLLAFGGTGSGEGKLAPEKMAACLRERNVIWLRQTFIEYTTLHSEMTSDFGGAFAQSMAWKCGVLVFK